MLKGIRARHIWTRSLVFLVLITMAGTALAALNLWRPQSCPSFDLARQAAAIYYTLKGVQYHPALPVDRTRSYELEVWVTRWPVFWDGRTYGEYLEHVSDLFRERYPNVKIKYHEYPIGRVSEELRYALDSGSPPDVYSGPFDPEFVRSGLQVPVTSFVTKEDMANFDPVALSSVTVDDQIWAWPRWYEPRGWLINPRFLEPAGVELKDLLTAGWTWDQALAAAGKSGYILINPSSRTWLHDLEMNSGAPPAEAQAAATRLFDSLSAKKLLVSDTARMQRFVADLVRGDAFAIASAGPAILRYFADAEFEEGFTRTSPVLVPVPHRKGSSPVPPYELEVTAAFVDALPHPAEDYRVKARLAIEFARFLNRTELPWLSKSLQVIPANISDRANWIAEMKMHPMQASFVKFFLDNARPLTGPEPLQGP